jgi:pantetheine-phosphate adenylyltransferase
MRRAVCPGSFDPVTLGHLDIVERASAIYDEVTVAVLVNKKKSSLFSVEERMDLLTQVTAVYGNVKVDSFHGLLVDYCRTQQIPVIVKGLRAISDFDYELQMAQMNHGLAGVETMFMTTNPLFSFLSSSLVKEVATYGGDVSGLVPPLVLQHLRERLGATPTGTVTAS